MLRVMGVDATGKMGLGFGTGYSGSVELVEESQVVKKGGWIQDH